MGIDEGTGHLFTDRYTPGLPSILRGWLVAILYDRSDLKLPD